MVPDSSNAIQVITTRTQKGPPSVTTENYAEQTLGIKGFITMTLYFDISYQIAMVHTSGMVGNNLSYR